MASDVWAISDSGNDLWLVQGQTLPEPVVTYCQYVDYVD